MNKYLIAGAGGTGGSIAGMMSLAGKDVTLIARGPHLDAIRKGGLTLIHQDNDGTEHIDTAGVRAVSSEEYERSGECPDVIFLCTMSYSVRDIAPFINRIAGKDTIIIPTLNGIRMADFVRQYVRSANILDGCIYIYGEKEAPGVVRIKGDFFRIIFGRDGSSEMPVEEAGLREIEKDIRDSGIRSLYTKDILTETVRKFSFVSPAGGTMLYYGSDAGAIKRDDEQRRFFLGMVGEVEALGRAMGADFGGPLDEGNIEILNNSADDALTSMVRDIRAGRMSEFDSLIGRPLRLGRELGVDMPHYSMVLACMEDPNGK